MLRPVAHGRYMVKGRGLGEGSHSVTPGPPTLRIATAPAMITHPPSPTHHRMSQKPKASASAKPALPSAAQLKLPGSLLDLATY